MTTNEKLKTVWHWKQVFQGLLLILAVGAAWGALTYLTGLQRPWTFILGAIIGFINGIIIAKKMNLYHFEWVPRRDPKRIS